MIDSRRKSPPNRWRRSSLISAIVFVGIIGGELAVAAVIKHAALEEIGSQLSCPVESVAVDGVRINGSGRLMNAIRNMHGTIGHHSHPTKRYHVSIGTSCGQLHLDFARDSQDPHEFWVFYPGFYSTRLSDIGHAFTDVLDGS
jgi:hypothetical protein